MLLTTSSITSPLPAPKCKFDEGSLSELSYNLMLKFKNWKSQ